MLLLNFADDGTTLVLLDEFIHLEKPQAADFNTLNLTLNFLT